MKIEVDSSDLLKIEDALIRAESFFRFRDKMNGSIHLATEVRYSPITSVVEAARDRCRDILESALGKDLT